MEKKVNVKIIKNVHKKHKLGFSIGEIVSLNENVANDWINKGICQLIDKPNEEQTFNNLGVEIIEIPEILNKVQKTYKKKTK